MSPERRQRLPAQYCHHCFPWEMTSERRSRKLHTDDALLVLLIGRAAWEICFNKSEALPDLRNDTSSVWSFCAQTSIKVTYLCPDGDLCRLRFSTVFSLLA